MDQIKLEAAIQFGSVTSLYDWFEDKDIEDMAKIFNKLWCDYQSSLKYKYFIEYLADILNNKERSIEIFKAKLAKEIGEWYGTFKYENGIYYIDNGEETFMYANATNLLRGWYNTIKCEHECGDQDWSIEMKFIEEFCQGGTNMKKINCPSCGKELIRLEPFEEDAYEFWCDDCDIDITIKRNED